MSVILFIISILLLIFGGLVVNEIKFRITRKKNPVPASAKSGQFFDSKLRKFLQPPKYIINRSGIKKGMTILDLGCGSGAYITDAAKLVGKHGTVYGTDLQDEMLSQLKRKLEKD